MKRLGIIPLILILSLLLPGNVTFAGIPDKAKNELIEERTATSKTFEFDTGERQLVVSLGSLHYKDAEGNWQDIDNEYSESDSGDYTAKFTKLPYLVRIADSSARRIYPDRNDLTYWIDIGKPFPSMGTPEKSGNTWTWDYTNATIKVELQSDAVKFNFILKNSSAPTSITVPFSASGITRKGRLLLHDGERVVEMRKPIATDANGVERDVEILFGGGKVTLSLDTSGLAFPIDIDPTWQVGQSSDDCRRTPSAAGFSLTTAQQVVGADQEIIAGMGGGMRFTNITIPHGSTIDNGTYLTIRARSSRAGDDVNSRITAEDIDDAPTFADNAAAFDARFANRTTAFVRWGAIPAWTINNDYDSPEIKTVIAEIVARPGWASGQDMVIFWEDYEDLSTHGVNCYRDGLSFDGSSDFAPQLTIVFTPSPPTVIANVATDIGDGEAALHGDITNTGNGNCTERGFVWDTLNQVNPGNVAPPATYANSWTESGSFGTGAFTHIITGLTGPAVYYWRACTLNAFGAWGYSDEHSFFIGEEGKVYLELRPDLSETRIRGQGTPADIQIGIFNGYIMPDWAQNDEELFFLICVPDRWDGESDIIVHMKWATGADDGNFNEDGKRAYWELAWDHSTPNVVESLPTGAVTQLLVDRLVESPLRYSHYQESFIIDYDETPDDTILINDTLALRLRHLPDLLEYDPIAFEMGVAFARGDLLGNPGDIITEEDMEELAEELGEIGTQWGIFNLIFEGWMPVALLFLGLILLLGLSFLAFWKESVVVFMLVGGVSMVLALYWFDVFVNDFGLGIGLILICYSLVGFGFGFKCIFWRKFKIAGDED